DPVVTQWEDDGDGDVTAIADGRGNRVTQLYDALGRLTSIRYPDGTLSLFEYDAENNVVSSTDARGLRRLPTYDKLGRLLRVTVDRLGVTPGTIVVGEDYEEYR